MAAVAVILFSIFRVVALFWDFNEILYSTEMKGVHRAQWQMNNFRNVVNDIRIRDLVYERYGFTYENGQVGDDNRQCRIDRAMVSIDWQDIYPFARLVHLTREWSDHCPIKVVFDGRDGVEGGCSQKFRFEQIWVGKDGCEEAVRSAWRRDNEDLMTSIENCATSLFQWKKVSNGKILKELSKKRNRLKILNEGERTESSF
ncbi:uncharacterized protein LOC141608195 [Silene latifolia]|uniref:uncharacterized protein LOC141608195 n=1 Tax=Silene latifolia TaxID=37657 RepID=UPI003D784C2A